MLAHASDTPARLMPHRPWLHRYAMLLVVATFVLLTVGGNVTSLDAGLAVPDGFTSFGYFIWFAPPDRWIGDRGRFIEHTHRLIGSVVGLLTIGLALWLWLTQRGRPWLRWLGLALVIGVIVQGVMGALRVDERSTLLAFVHGVMGQVFLGATVVAAAAVSGVWRDYASEPGRAEPGSHPMTPSSIRGDLVSDRGRDGPARWARWGWWGCLTLLAVLLIQLTLGAAVRHTQADRAIPDFPLAYGQIVPPMTQHAVDAAQAELAATQRPVGVPLPPPTLPPNRDADGQPVVSAGQVHVQFAHRLGAIVVVGVAVWVVVGVMRGLRRTGRMRIALPPAVLLIGLLAVQVMLGAMTIWTDTAPPVATAHQATGAAVLATAVWLTLRVGLALGRPIAQPSSSTPLPHEGEGSRGRALHGEALPA